MEFHDIALKPLFCKFCRDRSSLFVEKIHFHLDRVQSYFHLN